MAYEISLKTTFNGLVSRHRMDRGSAPPTPPSIRVRTTAVREVALTRFEQGRESKRFEVGIGEPQRPGSSGTSSDGP
jgi:hypothetical protein